MGGVLSIAVGCWENVLRETAPLRNPNAGASEGYRVQSAKGNMLLAVEGR